MCCAPAGIPELHLSLETEDLTCADVRAAALRIDARLPMGRMVEGLDRIRSGVHGHPRARLTRVGPEPLDAVHAAPRNVPDSVLDEPVTPRGLG